MIYLQWNQKVQDHIKKLISSHKPGNDIRHFKKVNRCDGSQIVFLGNDGLSQHQTLARLKISTGDITKTFRSNARARQEMVSYQKERSVHILLAR